MTLGLFIPLALLVISIIELPIFLLLRQRSAMTQRGFALVALASAALPLIAYGVLNYLVPDIGAMEVF